MKKKYLKHSLPVLLVVLLTLSLFFVGCGAQSASKDAKGSNNAEDSKKPVKVRVGLIGSDSLIWNHIKKEAANENIEVEPVFFDSYPLPNAALNSGEIEMDAFQHHLYLDTESKQHGYKISVIGETVFAPLGLYSKKLKSVDELKDGDTIVIPDDVTNGGRSLLLLQDAGLITVDPDAGATPTVKDIKNPRKFKIMELEAANIPASLEEVPLAAINSGIASDAGWTPAKDALVLENAKSGENPYVNVIAVRTEDKDNPVYRRIVELCHTDAVKEIIKKDSKGSEIPVW